MLTHNREKRTTWMENSTSRSNFKAEENEWTDLWNVNVPPKVRNFLWRLARLSLPTTDVRHHRHMAATSSCTLCGAEDSWMHSLLECNMSRCVWTLEGGRLLSYCNTFRCQMPRAGCRQCCRHSRTHSAHEW
jgi:hypothetical protein